MPFDPDDPRFTAFALGELDLADREAIEAMIADDPDGRAFVDGVSETARLLTDQLHHEATDHIGLDNLRRNAIEEKLVDGSPVISLPEATVAKKSALWSNLIRLAVAASLIGVTVGLIWPSIQDGRPARPQNTIMLAQDDMVPHVSAPSETVASAAPDAEASLRAPIGNIQEKFNKLSDVNDAVDFALVTTESGKTASLDGMRRTAAPSAAPSPSDLALNEAKTRSRSLREAEPANRSKGLVKRLDNSGLAAAPQPSGRISQNSGQKQLLEPLAASAKPGAGLPDTTSQPGPASGGYVANANEQAKPDNLFVASPLTRGFSRGEQGQQVAQGGQDFGEKPMSLATLPGGLAKPGQHTANFGYQPGKSGDQTSMSGDQSGKPGDQYGTNPAPPIVNPILTQNLGGRNPIIVGSQSPGQAGNSPRYMDGLGAPFIQGSASQIAPFNAAPKQGMPAPRSPEKLASASLAYAKMAPQNQPGKQPADSAPVVLSAPATVPAEPVPAPVMAGTATARLSQLQTGRIENERLSVAKSQHALGLEVAQDKLSKDSTKKKELGDQSTPRILILGEVEKVLEDSRAKAGEAEERRPADAKLLAELDAKNAQIVEAQKRVELLRRKQVVAQDRVNRETYARQYDNPFVNVIPEVSQLSTFSVDVDTASYANIRRFLGQGELPPVDAVRIEEMINYFAYNDPAPKGDVPFSVNLESAGCPWNASHRLVRIGLMGRTIDKDKRPMSNLVFLIDTSGSMADLNKLPFLKAGMKLLVEQLSENDRVAIVTYSNEVKLALPSTPCHRKDDILKVLDSLKAEGGTNGGAGIQMAYAHAKEFFIKGGTNRVILATDGDFNVGLSKEELLATSEERAKSGICLSVLGFGQGNIQEDFMEQLADKGNGNFSYIDNIDEARKVLVRQLSGTLVVIAKDVKIQVEFNPSKVSAYRLIGYENRVMANEDFRNDKKDAGEIGAGHHVTALYEIVPSGAAQNVAAVVDRPLKYVRTAVKPLASKADAAPDISPETLTVFLRYKQPDGDKATEINQALTDDGRDFGKASTNLKFASSVAGFGMLLRESPYKGTLTLPAVHEIASSALGEDPNGDRKQFLGLIKQAEQIVSPEER